MYFHNKLYCIVLYCIVLKHTSEISVGIEQHQNQCERFVFARLHGNVYSCSAMETASKCFRCGREVTIFFKLFLNLFKTVAEYKRKAKSLAVCSNSCVAALSVVPRPIER